MSSLSCISVSSTVWRQHTLCVLSTSGLLTSTYIYLTLKLTNQKHWLQVLESKLSNTAPASWHCWYTCTCVEDIHAYYTLSALYTIHTVSLYTLCTAEQIWWLNTIPCILQCLYYIYPSLCPRGHSQPMNWRQHTHNTTVTAQLMSMGYQSINLHPMPSSMSMP